MKYTIILFLMFIAAGCQHKTTDNKAITVDPGKAALSVEQVFEDYYAIPLETTPDNLIAGIDKIEMADNKFYILDKKSHVITIFDKDGFYISKIDRRGEGPEEYLDIADFAITDSSIYVLSRAGKKIIAYDHSGSFIRNYTLDDYYDFFVIDANNIFLYSNYSNNKLYNVIVADFNKNIVPSKEFLPFLKNQNFSFHNNPFNRNNHGGLFICQQYDNNIYRLNKDSIVTAYNINFITEDMVPPNVEEIGFYRVYSELAHKSVVKRITHVNQYNNFLYIIYIFEYVNHITKIDTETFTASSLKLEFNDVHPFAFAHPLCFYKDYLVGYTPAESVLIFDEAFESDKNASKRLQGDDNPVLFFHKLKND